MYSTLDNVRDSLKLAWKYKILWVFALLVAAGGGGGGGGGFDGFEEGMFDGYEEDSYYEYEVSPAESEALSFVNYNVEADVLGANADESDQNPGDGIHFGIFEDVEEWVYDLEEAFYTPGLPFFILVPISALILIIYAIFVGMIVRAWSLSALLAGTLKGIRDERISRKDLGEFGLKNIWTFVKIDLRVMFYVFGIILAVGVFTAIMAAIHDALFALAFLTIIGALVVIILIALGMSFAYRHVVFQKVDSKEAIKMGINTFKANWLDTVKLIFVSTIAMSIITFAMVAIVITVSGIYIAGFGFAYAATDNLWFAIPTVLVAASLLVAFALAFMSTKSFNTLFKEFAWTKLFFHTQRVQDLNTINLDSGMTAGGSNGTS